MFEKYSNNDKCFIETRDIDFDKLEDSNIVFTNSGGKSTVHFEYLRNKKPQLSEKDDLEHEICIFGVKSFDTFWDCFGDGNNCEHRNSEQGITTISIGKDKIFINDNGKGYSFIKNYIIKSPKGYCFILIEEDSDYFGKNCDGIRHLGGADGITLVDSDCIDNNLNRFIDCQSIKKC